ncbi:MAG: carbohydrate-binding domain-containing protein [Ruminiclostridium sp.]|nr:carbohydrate-binding domain-containing protein [Ruminiclostridium sp.]
MKKSTLISILAAACIAMSACSAETGAPQSVTSSEMNAAESTAKSSGTLEAAVSGTSVSSAIGNVSLSFSDMFTARDLETGYSDCTVITISDSGSTVSGSGVSVSGSVITITEKGSYRITGTLTNGQIVIDAGEEKVQLVLDGAAVTCEGSAALYVKSADKVFVTTASGTSNSLSSTGEFVQSGDDKIDGAVFSKSDITFNGSGSLDISCETAHGIVCKDDLKIAGGSYTITAAKKGVDCNESVRIASGEIAVTSGTDGIHAENSDDASKAFVYIGGGNITITSGGDAIDASGIIDAEDGTVTIKSDGGAAKAPAHTENFGMRWDRDTASTSDSENSSSAKGLKADGAVVINGGEFVIDSSDDAIHSNDSVTVTGGSLTLSSGDDGIHADNSVLISDGAVIITTSYEGIEGEVIEISGGSVSVKASDDGMNASGGSSDNSTNSGNNGNRSGFMDTDANAKLTISGGNIVVNANGDGLDSNGYLTVSGGTVFVSGPTNGGNGAIDYGISGSITGGKLIAAGSTGMAENFGSDSTQGSILYTFDGTISAGTEIQLLDESGNVLVSYAPEKEYQCAVISAPEVTAGKTYTVKVGDKSYTVEMTSNIYGEGSGMGGFGGGFGGFGGDGQMPEMQSDGQMPQPPSDGQMPEMQSDGQMPQPPSGGQFPPQGGRPDMGGRGGFGNGGNRQQLPTSEGTAT